jgi:polyisoprenoid-binding protein YceI
MSFGFAILLTLATTLFQAKGPCVAAGRGHFSIHVGSAGVFGAFGHDHLIQAQKITGCATVDSKDLARSSIKLEFAADGLRVIDPKESSKDRAEVQKTMEREVLRIQEFPKITFESTAVEATQGTERLRIRGNLTIRGKTQPVVIPVVLTHLTDGTYRATGETRFKQTAFGITPVKVGGGTVKVKDELRIEFELFLR